MKIRNNRIKWSSMVAFVVIPGMNLLANPGSLAEDIQSDSQDFLAQLAPTPEELVLRNEAKIGWPRIMPTTDDDSIPVIINYYKQRGGTLYIRGCIEGDDLSLLCITVSNGKMRGNLVIPGEGSYSIGSAQSRVQMAPQEDLPWRCSNHGFQRIQNERIH